MLKVGRIQSWARSQGRRAHADTRGAPAAVADGWATARERTRMTPQAPTTLPTPVFTPAQQRALHILQRRYQEDRDFFTRCELARLRFLRWLYQKGRLVP
jgi:hypothetical protein